MTTENAPAQPRIASQDAGAGHLLLIDLSAFFIGFQAYADVSRESGGGSPTLTQRGVVLIKRFQPLLIPQMEAVLGPLVDEDAAFARLRPQYRRAILAKRGAEQAAIQAGFLKEVFILLKRRPERLRQVFTGKASNGAMKLGRTVAQGDPRSILNQLALLPPMTSRRVLRKWLREAAKEVGAAPSPMEALISDVSEAKDMGARLRDLAARITAAREAGREEEAATLAEERAGLMAAVNEAAEESSAPAAVLGAAASAATSDPGHSYETEIGKKVNLTPEQEAAMMVRGRGIIAAGAGSGKTRVLAAKVFWHIDSGNMSPSNVLATSFTRKSSEELIRRIEDYGTSIDRWARDGFGTTHSIAGRMLNQIAPGFRRPEGYIGPKENWKHVTILRLAMEQVQMSVPGIRPPAPRGFWDEAVASASSLADEQAKEDLAEACTTAIGYFQWIMNQGWWSRGNKSFGRAPDMVQFLQHIRGKHPRELKDNEKKAANNIFKKAKRYRKPLRYRVAATKKAPVTPAPEGKVAAPVNFPAPDNGEGDSPGGKGAKLKEYKFYNVPAEQWFNIGAKLIQEDDKGGEVPVPLGVFKNFISIAKGQAVTPSQAWANGIEGVVQPESDEAAVYGAYEWLKGNDGEPKFQNLGDMTDLLIDTVSALVGSERVRGMVQNRFKVVMVDEAQDLNKCVHGDTEVQTPDGPKTVRNLQEGDQVLSYENGRVLYNRVRERVPSSWERGYKVHLSTGETLAMSPDHRIYATPLDGCREGEMALYLMYRKDMGFRIGTSARLFENRGTSQGRAAQEGADCAWILEIGTPEEMLFKEQALSLTHGVPTYIFGGTARGCDQDRINQLFQEFGENGRDLLGHYDLSFEHPHWVASAAERGRKNRQVVNFCAHRNKSGQRGSHVSMTWTNGDFDLNIPVYQIKEGRKMAARLTVDYAAGRAAALDIARRTGAFVVESLSLHNEKLPLVTASALFPGMKVPVWRGGVDLKTMLPIEDYKEIARRLEVSLDDVGGSRNTGKVEIHTFLRDLQIQRGVRDILPPVDGAVVDLVEIEQVEQIEGGDYWDISVEGAHNFFGNGVLSHNCQHILFGLIAGYYDHLTQEPREDKQMTADTYCLIGDDKQCLEKGSMISTPSGRVPLHTLSEGDSVLSYRNGQIVPQNLRHMVQSTWTWGYKVTLADGRTLTMSPTHKLWSTAAPTPGKVMVYLMHRSDLGFRIGITNKGWAKRGTGYLKGFGGRAFTEKAEKLWVLNVCDTREEALLLESSLSLEWGIPTCVFNGEKRGLNQDRINTIFQRFGGNGARLLEDRHLKESLPHWSSQGYTKHGRGRSVVQLTAHTAQGTQVTLEWPDDSLDERVAHIPPSRKGNVYTIRSDGGRRIRRYFPNYREGLRFAEALAEAVGGFLSHQLSTSEGKITYLTASALLVGMQLAVDDGEGGLDLMTITDIEKTKGEFIDVDVEDASNLFAEQILVSNSIYEFRGADPKEFINKSDMTPGGDQFSTRLITTNFRSGSSIVNSANSLIARNTAQGQQIPMTCNAFPGRKGEGEILRRSAASTSDAAVQVAEEIQGRIQDGLVPPHDKRKGHGGYAHFGVAVRSNREAYEYGIEMLKRGIPFKSKARFFNDKYSKAMIGWMTLAEGRSAEEENQALLDALAAPFSKVSPKTLQDRLSRVDGRWADQIQKPTVRRRVYRHPTALERLEKFAKNVKKAKAASGSPEEILNEILDLVGIDEQDFKNALITAVREDADRMAELEAAAAGDVTEDAIIEEALAPLAPLLGLLREKEDLNEAMGFVRRLKKVNDKISSGDDVDDLDRDAVTIGTMHSWKGLEAPEMFIPMVAGKFPRVPKGEEKAPEGPALWAERRLAYVAITRAEDRAILMDIPSTNPKARVHASQFFEEACIPIQGISGGEDEEEVREASIQEEEPQGQPEAGPAPGEEMDEDAILDLIDAVDKMPEDLPKGSEPLPEAPEDVKEVDELEAVWFQGE